MNDEDKLAAHFFELAAKYTDGNAEYGQVGTPDADPDAEVTRARMWRAGVDLYLKHGMSLADAEAAADRVMHRNASRAPPPGLEPWSAVVLVLEDATYGPSYIGPFTSVDQATTWHDELWPDDDRPWTVAKLAVPT